MRSSASFCLRSSEGNSKSSLSLLRLAPVPASRPLLWRHGQPRKSWRTDTSGPRISWLADASGSHENDGVRTRPGAMAMMAHGCLRDCWERGHKASLFVFRRPTINCHLCRNGSHSDDQERPPAEWRSRNERNFVLASSSLYFDCPRRFTSANYNPLNPALETELQTDVESKSFVVSKSIPLIETLRLWKSHC